MHPKRTALLGNGGGGKSTLARKMSDAWNIPCFPVDQAQFKPGWEREDLGQVAKWHAGILKQDRWIIDGWGAWELIDARMELADLIVLVDYPLDEHLALAAKRSDLSRSGVSPDAPPGCAYHEIDELMVETLRRVDKDFMPILREKVAARPSDQEVLVFHSIDELSAWSSENL